MSDNNVKYDTIQANKLILGNEEDGFIELMVTNVEGNISLGIISRDNSKGGIVLGFYNGQPTIALLNRDDEKEPVGAILSFNKEGLPVLRMSGKSNSGAIILELRDNELPQLSLSGRTDGESDESAVHLGFNPDGDLHLLLSGEGIKGGNILLRADGDSAGVMLTSRDRIKDGENWGVFMYSDPGESILDVEGENYINEPRENKEVDSEE